MVLLCSFCRLRSGRTYRADLPVDSGDSARAGNYTPKNGHPLANEQNRRPCRCIRVGLGIRRNLKALLGTSVIVANQSYVNGDATHQAILDVETGEEGLTPFIPPAPSSAPAPKHRAHHKKKHKKRKRRRHHR